ncbi:unnamed protein product [Fusarium graminearum]|uniref:Chromosome 2, complete genome n=1 Tax=Gibberella zeae (strain ATCC MYA-4620 / CBS 123657 / FGSC 9075 / NRRL 31084 / PH-1) TaxID=229533 RepID=A0A098DEF1_GIBZE|nr:unnamed protein product [Fusarium graminearum]CZS80111.1 unnamed protein product [Fusarium graminearum]
MTHCDQGKDVMTWEHLCLLSIQLAIFIVEKLASELWCIKLNNQRVWSKQHKLSTY